MWFGKATTLRLGSIWSAYFLGLNPCKMGREVVWEMAFCDALFIPINYNYKFILICIKSLYLFLDHVLPPCSLPIHAPCLR